MFFTYLRGELASRRRQTLIVVFGMAVAVALIIIVNSVAAGVKTAQEEVLSTVYGVGTDLTVTQPSEPGSGIPGGPGGRFDFDAEDGTADDEGTRQIATSRLVPGFGTGTMADGAVSTVAGLANVEAASAALSLTNTTFSGELPDFSQGPPQPGQAFGGADGAGGSAFEVTTFDVTGVDLNAAAVGPLSSIQVIEGRALASSDSGESVVVVDSVYATSESLAVGDTVEIGGSTAEVVGIVGSTNGEGVATSADVYTSLTTAQTLAELSGQITDIYVQADSAGNIDAAQAQIQAALPDATVSSQADLAGSVSGSLSNASDLAGRLGTWLSIAVLAAAFAVAALFTVSGVTRRTREFGTLKAIGWRDSRIVRQVAGESVVQGLLGGALGAALGLIGVVVINQTGITLAGSTGGDAALPPGPGGGAGGGPFGALREAATAPAIDVALRVPVSVTVLIAGIALAVLGGLLAGAIGGRRAAALRPAEALRSAS